MPSTRYSFSCNTQHDLDVIQFLDSFPANERTIAIKAALRQYFMPSEENASMIAPNIEALEEQITTILKELVDIRQSLANYERHDIINNDLGNKHLGHLVDQEVHTNLNKLFEG